MSEPQDPTLADLVGLFAAGDADDRAYAAFLLGGFPEQAAVETLAKGLHDSAPDVRSFSAQSLAQQGKVEYLPDILELIDRASGQEVTPLPWAAVALADRASPDVKARAMAELRNLSTRASPAVSEQLRLLGVTSE